MSESSLPLHEVEQLIWELMDDRITEPGFRRLTKLLSEDADARRTYLSCIQLHADLHHHFSGQEDVLPAAATGEVTTPTPPLEIEGPPDGGPATEIDHR
jgi:hypothetical protein